VVHVALFCCKPYLANYRDPSTAKVMLEQMRKNIIDQSIEAIKLLPLFIIALYIMKIAIDEVGTLLYWLLGM
jgi:hypothetical protein